MPKEKGPTYSSAAQSVIAELTQPITLDEFVQHVLERFPSRAKDPRQNVRNYLRWDGIDDGIVFLDTKTLVPLQVGLRGVRFRVPLDPAEIEQGVVMAEPGFTPFVKRSARYGWLAVKGEFWDANDQPIPSRVISSPTTMKSFIDGKSVEINHPAFELREWLGEKNAKPGDSLLVTVLDLAQGYFRLEFEPRAQRRESEIEKQNHAWADLIWMMLQDTVYEELLTHIGIPTAFARFPTARDYPGDHWSKVLHADPRMRVTDWSINTADHRVPLDLILNPFDEPTVAEQPFTPEQGAQVYRFQANANYRKHECTIEILGKHTLADFDQAMRKVFRLDSMDHLSEFTHVIRRGKGKKPHKRAFGEINPFEKTQAMKLRVAGLGLDVNTELEYVYDFSDWLDHTLVLQSIVGAEKGVQYPRAVQMPAKLPKRKATSKSKPMPEQPRCGLCGSTDKPLTRTPCCGNWICDDEDDYVLFSYATNSCHRNHDRYTLCSSHYNEGHKGRWQDCQKCRESFETEMYVWYGTNEYNFEKLANPPAFEPTHCTECGRVIHLGTDGYMMSGGKYYCDKCSNKRMRHVLASEKLPRKKK